MRDLRRAGAGMLTSRGLDLRTAVRRRFRDEIVLTGAEIGHARLGGDRFFLALELGRARRSASEPCLARIASSASSSATASESDGVVERPP